MKEKAAVFYNVLQEGGVDKNPQIGAEDKDFRPCFIKMCKLATCDIFKLAVKFGENIRDFYTDSECAQMVNEENLEAMIEDHFLEVVYGMTSRITAEDWMEKVSDKEQVAWIIMPDKLRAKLLE